MTTRVAVAAAVLGVGLAVVAASWIKLIGRELMEQIDRRWEQRADQHPILRLLKDPEERES